MCANFKANRFGCMKDFRHLNGRRKQIVVIANEPDIRTSKFLCKTRVKHYYPSQWHTRYRQGYMEFENSQKFDLETESVNGKRVYLFEFTQCVEIVFLRQTAKNTILETLRKAPDAEREPMADLMAEQAGFKTHSMWFLGSWAEESVHSYLEALSLRQLEDLAGLFISALPVAERLAA
ncbi:MAG TPA: hypothetical protein VG206_15505 [Terriglobia bacterium]|nr:hypothetical protein [Terriglobia bacterium]